VTAINANMTNAVNWLPLSKANALRLVPGWYTLDSENIEVGGVHFARPALPSSSQPNGRWAKRGRAGSIAASHTSGATLTRYYPDAPGGALASPLLVAEVTLTDDDIKALGTQVGFELVATPGPGKFFAFISGLIVIDASAVAYGNIDVGASLAFGNGSLDLSVPITAAGGLAALLGDDGETALVMLPPAVAAAAGGGVMGTYLDASQAEDKPLVLAAWNNNAGPFDGGDPANSGRAKVWYTVEDLP
jgi:hypothetical protein